MTMLKRGPNGSASLEASSGCLVDSAGKIIRETKVASDPDALIEYFVSLGLELKRIGLEAGHCLNGCMKA